MSNSALDEAELLMWHISQICQLATNPGYMPHAVHHRVKVFINEIVLFKIHFFNAIYQSKHKLQTSQRSDRATVGHGPELTQPTPEIYGKII